MNHAPILRNLTSVAPSLWLHGDTLRLITVVHTLRCWTAQTVIQGQLKLHCQWYKHAGIEKLARHRVHSDFILDAAVAAAIL